MNDADALPEVPVDPMPLERFRPIVGDGRMEAALAVAARARAALDGRTVWNVNSTAAGGGVAEMLAALLPYARGAGVDARWLVIRGDEDFYRTTKRVHNGLHGSAGDGGMLGRDEAGHYAEVTARNLEALQDAIRPGDVAILHDPQTAGLVEGLKAHGARVLWRCHIGHDHPNEYVRRSWAFLRPMLEPADGFCFTRAAYAPDWVPPAKRHVVPPSIDPFSPKNQAMDPATARAIVAHLGLIADGRPARQQLRFTRHDGSPGFVERHADVQHSGPLPDPDAPLIVQVSRWDRLKDMAGVLRGFADFVSERCDATLALVGPTVHGVSDDPEGAATYDHCVDVWRGLPHFERNRVMLVCLPMADVEENAAMVNAIQRQAAIVVQKSLYEGFGLTVTEALWKARPVIATAVGGITEQIEDSINGLLIDDPTDLEQFGRSMCLLLNDPELARRLGEAGHRTAVEHFLAPRHLSQYAELVLALG